MTEIDVNRLWLKSYDREVSPNLQYEPAPLFSYLDRNVQKTPHHTAITFNNWNISYKQLGQLSDNLAANLCAAGLRQGDKVAVMLPNTPQTIISYWGILKAGGIVVMTNPLYMEKEIEHHFSDSGARFLIILDLVWPKIEPWFKTLPLEQVFITSIADCLKFPLNLLYSLKKRREKNFQPLFFHQHIHPWRKLLQKKSGFQRPVVKPTDVAMLQYTGGTTGISKGVMLTHSNLGINIKQCETALHDLSGKKHTVLGVLPYFHIYGLTVCVNFATALGATLAPFPRFVPGELLQAIDRLRPTIFPCAPAIFVALLQQKNIRHYDLSSIQYCISGSAPIPVEIINKFKELTGAEIIEGFGLTEASPITHLNPLRGKRKPGSIGLPFPGTDAAIVDMEVGSISVPQGKIGELVIRGPQVMRGYWQRPDETATALRNSWLYTGDIAYMDEDGYFFIVDRKKDMIITGGYNVYPREIDEVLYEHPKVQEAVSLGVPSKTRGEHIKAYIVPKQGEEITQEEIIHFCRKKLASYKVPRKVEFRRELPKSMVGKVLRRILYEEEMKKREE